jgi:hypothetical protein
MRTNIYTIKFIRNSNGIKMVPFSSVELNCIFAALNQTMDKMPLNPRVEIEYKHDDDLLEADLDVSSQHSSCLNIFNFIEELKIKVKDFDFIRNMVIEIVTTDTFVINRD